MIYRIRCEIELDTRTNKVAIIYDDKRLVFFPGKKVAEHWCDVSLNDRPLGPFSYAKDLCKLMVRTLHGRKHIKQAVKEVALPFMHGGSNASS